LRLEATRAIDHAAPSVVADLQRKNAEAPVSEAEQVIRRLTGAAAIVGKDRVGVRAGVHVCGDEGKLSPPGELEKTIAVAEAIEDEAVDDSAADVPGG
jgi:hypothetical protein